MDMYKPIGDTATNRIAVIWVHGGSFSFDKNDFANTACDYANVDLCLFHQLSQTDHTVTPTSND
jgi:hypothetical protein